MNERNDITLVFSRRNGSLQGRDEHSSPKHRLCEGPEASRGARPAPGGMPACRRRPGAGREPGKASAPGNVPGLPGTACRPVPPSQGLSSTSAHRSPAQMIRGVSFPLHAWVG